MPCGHRCWYSRWEIPSQPVRCPGAVCSHFLEEIQGPRWAKCQAPHRRQNKAEMLEPDPDPPLQSGFMSRAGMAASLGCFFVCIFLHV